MTRLAAIIVASTRGAAGAREDTTGPVLEEWLAGCGFETRREVVADGEPVGQAIGRALAAGARIIITAGGTGVSPTDATPEQTEPYVHQRLPGIEQALHSRADGDPGGVLLSRGVAGVHRGAGGPALVINVAGSVAAARRAVDVLGGVIGHAIDQLDGGDHVHAGHVHGDHEWLQAHAEAPLARPLARITETPIDAGVREKLEQTVRTDTDGAVVSFVGAVRTADAGRGDVIGLRYEAHPAAERVLGEVVDAVCAELGVRAGAVHRIGELGIGDIAVVCAVAAPHRAEAFTACAELVDRLKATVPIWKLQRYADGSDEWLGL